MIGGIDISQILSQIVTSAPTGKLWVPDDFSRPITVADTQTVTLPDEILLMPQHFEDMIQQYLVSPGCVDQRVLIMGGQLGLHYKEQGASVGNPVYMVPILTGGFIFATRLSQAMFPYVPINFNFGSSATYQGTTKMQGSLGLDLSKIPDGAHILFVEDVIDTLGTFETIHDFLYGLTGEGTRFGSVAIVSMADKSPSGEELVAIVSDPSDLMYGRGIERAGVLQRLEEKGVAVSSVDYPGSGMYTGPTQLVTLSGFNLGFRTWVGGEGLDTLQYFREVPGIFICAPNVIEQIESYN